MDDHRPIDHRQHRLRYLVGERPKSAPFAADENDGVHQPVVLVVPCGAVVVVFWGLVVVVEPFGLVVVVEPFGLVVVVVVGAVVVVVV